MNDFLTSSKKTVSACLALLLAPAAFGQVDFDPATSTVVGTQPSGIAFADFDGDGDTDIATTVDDPDRIVVLLNDGNGGYTLGPSTFLPASSSPQDCVAGDFNGDGMADIAVALRDPSGSIAIMQNTGGAAFVVAQTVSVGSRPRGLDVADFDVDGDLDLGCANRDGNSASILTNVGGSFTAVTLGAGAEPRALAFGDFDADGDLDAAVSNHDSRTVGIYTNTGGSFSLTSTLSTGGLVRPEGIDAADLDGDGDDDLATATNGNGFELVSVFMSTGGGFTGPIGYATGGIDTSDIVLADLDCDGIIDAATANNTSSNVSILAGLGGGAFGPAMLLGAGAGADDVSIGDIDGDGDMDLATANRDGNNVSIFRNQSCEAKVVCGSDINSDGVVDAQDLITLLGDWGPCPGCGSDLTGDGDVNVADLLQLILDWGPCPVG